MNIRSTLVRFWHDATPHLLGGILSPGSFFISKISREVSLGPIAGGNTFYVYNMPIQLAGFLHVASNLPWLPWVWMSWRGKNIMKICCNQKKVRNIDIKNCCQHLRAVTDHFFEHFRIIHILIRGRKQVPGKKNWNPKNNQFWNWCLVKQPYLM